MPWNSSTKSFKICRCCMKWRCKCLVPRQGKPLPPFNSGLKRDANIGMHPKFYQAASDAPGVGSYDLPALSTKSTARNWKKELETAEFSATMGGRLVEKYTVDRERMKTGLGPGIHEISQWPENILEKSCKTIRRDADFGTVHRFKPDIKSATPGPGVHRYTKKNPYHYLDENKRRGLSCVPSFEYDGLRPRFSTILKPWSLPCNLYNAKYPETLEAFLKKVTGKRGPYDLFTGPRDERTLIGYQKSIKLEDRGEWPKSLPSELDKLLQKSNYFKGRWTTCPRFPKKSGLRLMLQDLALSYKDPSHPGPGHYNPKSPGKPKNAKNYPFNSNVDFVRPGPPFEIQPGPGRYRIKETEKIRGHGWTWVFKSKAPRTNFLITRSYRSF
ncbi:ciliary microtubule-associated protein 2 [Nomia melanderi]|uniref:ciliary microtubule-associated protein 2 n=1 Tax=Nomia melanderi TaxID=2448451 RepID=UPI0013041E6C|nr:lymphocyte expansion molecule-like [Nomia melanderi]